MSGSNIQVSRLTGSFLILHLRINSFNFDCLSSRALTRLTGLLQQSQQHKFAQSCQAPRTRVGSRRRVHLRRRRALQPAVPHGGGRRRRRAAGFGALFNRGSKMAQKSVFLDVYTKILFKCHQAY